MYLHLHNYIIFATLHLFASFFLHSENVMLKKENVYLLRNTSFPGNCEHPTGTGNALLFYLQPQTAVGNVRTTIVSSRELVIGPLDPENVTLEFSNVMERDAMESDRESEARSNIVRDDRLATIFELVCNNAQLLLWSHDSYLANSMHKINSYTHNALGCT